MGFEISSETCPHNMPIRACSLCGTIAARHKKKAEEEIFGDSDERCPHSLSLTKRECKRCAADEAGAKFAGDAKARENKEREKIVQKLKQLHDSIFDFSANDKEDVLCDAHGRGWKTNCQECIAESQPEVDAIMEKFMTGELDSEEAEQQFQVIHEKFFVKDETASV